MKKQKTLLTIAIITIIATIGFILINSFNQPKGDLVKITYKEIKEKQKNKEDFILIVSQSTCSHCATYKPKVKQIAKEYNIKVYYVDIDLESNKEKILNELNLTGATPVTLFFHEGKETSILNRIEGDLATKTIINQLKKMGFID